MHTNEPSLMAAATLTATIRDLASVVDTYDTALIRQRLNHLNRALGALTTHDGVTVERGDEPGQIIVRINSDHIIRK